jgi:hypothetical protein
MVPFHHVRDHFRKKDTHVHDYERGQGSKASPYSGNYSGAPRPAGPVKMSIRERIQAKIAAAKHSREMENIERARANADARDKVSAERAIEHQKKIERDAELNAREGGFFKRSAKSLAKRGFEELKKSQSRKPRRVKHRQKRRKAKVAHKRRHSHTRKRVTEYY